MRESLNKSKQREEQEWIKRNVKEAQEILNIEF